jgi:hypothetical protein
MYYDDDVPATSGCLRATLLTVVAVAALGLLFYFGLNRIAADLNPFANLSFQSPFAPAPTEIAVEGPAVIEELRSLSRLEAHSAYIKEIITAGQQSGGTLYDLLRGDRLLLIAYGEVIAGFDLSKLEADDIVISEDGSTATVTLPPAEILVSRLDNERTQVYDRDVGLFTRGDPELETAARRVAEQQILQAACEGGVLNRAVEDGMRNIENLVRAFGFENVTVYASAGPCVMPGTSSGVAMPTPTP